MAGNVCIILGLLIILLFYLPVKTGGIWNIGNQTGMLIGLLLYGSGMFFDRLQYMIKVLMIYPAGKALLLMTGGCLLLILGIVIAETGMILMAILNRPDKEGTLVVLGCKLYEDKPSKTLAGRLMAAASYMHKNPQAVCIVSGGQGEDEPIPEAVSMKRYLMEQGVAPERIYMEDQSRSTEENLKLSLEIIEEMQLPSHIIIVTSGFHQYRASLLAKKLNLSHQALSGTTPWWLVPTFYVRELYGILYEKLKTIIPISHRSGNRNC